MPPGRARYATIACMPPLVPTGITDQTPLMTTKEVAAYLNLAAGVLYRWRREGKGPRSIRFPRGYRYRREDVEHWLEEQER